MSDSGALWNWSEQRWDSAEFRDACMQWQRHEGEVNLLLFAIWHGEQGVLWDEAYVMQLLSQTRSWREELLQPVRTLRHAIKSELGPGAEYEQAKDLELQLERRFQAKLCAMEPPPAGIEQRGSSRRSADRHNVGLLCRYSGISSGAWLGALFSQ